MLSLSGHCDGLGYSKGRVIKSLKFSLDKLFELSSEHSRGDVSNTLQAVTVPIISNAACRETGYSAKRITDNMLCAGYDDGEKDR